MPWQFIAVFEGAMDAFKVCCNEVRSSLRLPGSANVDANSVPWRKVLLWAGVSSAEPVCLSQQRALTQAAVVQT